MKCKQSQGLYSVMIHVIFDSSCLMSQHSVGRMIKGKEKVTNQMKRFLAEFAPGALPQQ